MRRTKNWQNILIIALIFAISQLDAVSAQQPCDNATQYLEDKGFIEQPYTIWSQGPTHYANESFFVVKLVIPIDERYPRTGTDKIYFIGCETGRIFDHRPTTGEIMGVQVPEKIDESLFIKMKTGPPDAEYVIYIATENYLTQDQIDELNQTVSDLRSSAPLIGANVTRDEFDLLSSIEWISIPESIPNYNFTGSEKVSVGLYSTAGILTEDQYAYLNQTGIEIFLIFQAINANATPSQIEEIADFDWVFIIREGGGVNVGMLDKEPKSKSAYYLGIFILVLAFLIIKRARGGKKGG